MCGAVPDRHAHRPAGSTLLCGGEQAGAIVDLRATDLTAPGSNKGTVVYVSGSGRALPSRPWR